MANLNQLFSGLTRTAGRGIQQAGGLGRGVFGRVQGLASRVANRNPEPKDLDDVTLARKVESEVFREADAPKGKVDVNAVDGVVWLRGEVKNPQAVKAIEARVRAIPEVREVENLLHLPKTPAPTRTDTPARQRRSKGSAKRTKAQKRPATGGRRITAEKRSADAEPTPAELAGTKSGRRAAPLGSDDTG